MTRTFYLYPTAKPDLVYAGASESESTLRKILANFIHSFLRPLKNPDREILMHVAVRQYNSAADWTIQETRFPCLDDALAELRKNESVTVLNGAARPEKEEGAYVVVKCEVAECPELFTYRFTRPEQSPTTVVQEMFRRFRQLNAMRATRGQILVEYPEALVKAISRWNHEDSWKSTVLQRLPTLKETHAYLSRLREENPATLDRSFNGEYPLDSRRQIEAKSSILEERSLCLLRWLRDLHVPSLSELNDMERQRGIEPAPLPLPGFITVLVSRATGKEKIISTLSSDPRDEAHVLQLAKAALKGIEEERWQRDFYVAPPIYCSDLNSARMIASSTRYLAASWDQFRDLLRQKRVC